MAATKCYARSPTFQDKIVKDCTQVWNLSRAMDVAYLILGSNDGTTDTTLAGDEDESREVYVLEAPDGEYEDGALDR